MAYKARDTNKNILTLDLMHLFLSKAPKIYKIHLPLDYTIFLTNKWASLQV
jgi:hypothetical protein